MRTIREIAQGPWQRGWASRPEMNPFTEPDALLDAQVLDIWVDALRGKVAVLFELRMAQHLRVGNAGLLVAHDLIEVRWRTERRETGRRTAWNVDSEPAVRDGELTLRLGGFPVVELLLRARAAAYYSLEVPGLDETPPNYGDAPDAWLSDDPVTLELTDAELDQQLPRWDSPAVMVHAVFLDPRRT